MEKPPQKLKYEDYISIYGKVPRLCVDLIIKNDEGILLSKRDIEPGKGMWHFIGGTILMGESINEATQRIAKEETGLNVFSAEFVGPMEFVASDNLFFHTISLVYTVIPENARPRGSFQGRELKYFSQLPAGMIDEHKQFVLVNHLL